MHEYGISKEETETMTETQTTKKKFEKELSELRSELQTLAGEVRVKVHLAGMEARDAWTKLEPRVKEFEGRMEKAGETAASELHEVAKDLRERLQGLCKRI
jgi:hypothetical protein